MAFFPFCHIGPMKWWSPEERAAEVMRLCAQPRGGKTPLTWITPRPSRRKASVLPGRTIVWPAYDELADIRLQRR